jgi:SAM-dependent methyltransferase
MLDNDDGGLLEQMAAPQPVLQPVPQAEIPRTIKVKFDEPPLANMLPPQIQQVPQGPSPEEIARHVEARKKHVADLMAIDCWPEAVPVFLMATASEEDQVNRAKSVLDMMMDSNIEGFSFLDYGCGDGWIAQEVLNRGVIESVGYDIVKSPEWDKRKGVFTTTNLNDLKHNHFDAIMLYDVLDHCEDPVAVMETVKKCLKRTGSVYIRCHPWTSRHANHIFKKGVNRGYLHLFLTWDEMCGIMGSEPMFTRQEKHPVEAYHWWFRDFEIKKERMIKEPVSEFFHVPAFKELLATEQGLPLAQADALLKQMEIQFVDYVLKLKK